MRGRAVLGLRQQVTEPSRASGRGGPGSGVTGRKVFFQFRGHGRSEAPDGPWTYSDLA
ncbi:alpha/beta hydrolase, partial [Micromonospora sp. NPDC002411]